jgi:hypothetical protein
MKRLLLVLLAMGSLGAAPAGLSLKLELADAKQPAFRLALVNTGAAPRKVVKPGDGSDVAWREPAIRWTGEVWQDGRWVALPMRAVGRCGNYSSNWQQDVVDLGPGQRLDFEWGTWPVTLVLPEHGRIRLTAHYDYGAGAHSKGGAVASTGAMGSTPRFTVASEPLEFVR